MRGISAVTLIASHCSTTQRRLVPTATYILGAQWNAGFANVLLLTASILMYVKVQSQNKTSAATTHAATTAPLPPTGVQARAGGCDGSDRQQPEARARCRPHAVARVGYRDRRRPGRARLPRVRCDGMEHGSGKIMVESRVSAASAHGTYQFFYSELRDRRKKSFHEYTRCRHQHWHFYDFAVYSCSTPGRRIPCAAARRRSASRTPTRSDMSVKNTSVRSQSTR